MLTPRQCLEFFTVAEWSRLCYWIDDTWSSGVPGHEEIGQGPVGRYMVKDQVRRIEFRVLRVIEHQGDYQARVIIYTKPRPVFHWLNLKNIKNPPPRPCPTTEPDVLETA
jgi:hypothetical protein